MTASRRERIGIPLGVAGLAVVAVVAVALTGGLGGGPGGAGGPARLPIRLSAGGAGAEDAAAPAARGMASSYLGVRYELPGDLPDDLPGEGRAYRLPGERADHAAVARLARAFGMTAGPVRSEESWVVRDGDREIRVFDAPGSPWHYTPVAKDVARGEPGCAEPAPPDGAEPAAVACPAPEVRPLPADGSGSGDTPVASDPGVASACASPPPGTDVDKCEDAYACPDPAPGSTSTSRCVPPPPPSPPVLPPEDHVRARIAPILEAAGLAGQPLTLRKDWGMWSAQVRPRVGGLDTVGYETHLAVGPELDVQYANGWLADPAPGDTYPLLSPPAAVERMAKAMPVPLIGIACDSVAGADCEVPAHATIQVTAVRLGLTMLYGDRREAYLVPAWLLTAEENGDVPVPVVAIPDEYLAPPPTDAPARDGGGTEPGVEPSGASGGGSGGSTGSGGAPAPATTAEPKPEPTGAPEPDPPAPGTSPPAG